MKFGCCTGIENLALLESCGYDYIELQVKQMVSYTEREFEQVKKQIGNSSIKAEVFNILLDKINITDGSYNETECRQYLEKGFLRASLLGGQVIVFGSGWARRMPEEVREVAVNQVIAFARLAGEIAEKYGMSIAIEPLNKKETNYINTIEEALELAKAIDRKNVKVLADLYHVDLENDMEAIDCAKGALIHVHIAKPKTREMPKLTDTYDYNLFFNKLKDIGYDGRISIEGHADNLKTDLKEGIKLFKSLVD